MNSDRIREIQETTGLPNSVSVKQALLQVWNECAQSKLYSEEEITFIKKVFLSYWLKNNSSHEDNLEEKIFSDKILEKLINK
jgi:hypothetical protein